MRIDNRIEHGVLQAGGQVQRAGQQAPSWVEKLARLGYAAKGVVYLLIGGLALMTVFQEGGSVGGGKNALASIAGGTFGQILLIVTAVGLAGYALWRFIQAGLDPENEGADGKGIAKRIGYVGSGLGHGALAVAAFRSEPGQGRRRRPQHPRLAVLRDDHPGGRGGGSRRLRRASVRHGALSTDSIPRLRGHRQHTTTSAGRARSTVAGAFSRLGLM